MILLRAANRTGRVWLVPRGLHGVIPANFAAGGGDPSPLENDADLPGDAATQFLWWLRTPLLDGSSNGVTTVTDAGAYTHTGADDGTWQQGYAWRALLADGSIESSVDVDAVISFTVGAAVSTLSGTAVIGAVQASGTIGVNPPSALSGTAVLGALSAAGSITSAAPSTITGAAALGSIVASGAIISLAPAVLSGAAQLGGLQMAGTATAGQPSALSGTAVLGRVAMAGVLQGLVVAAADNPTAYYRRNARDVLNGRRRGDGAGVMMGVGARRRL